MRIDLISEILELLPEVLGLHGLHLFVVRGCEAHIFHSQIRTCQNKGEYVHRHIRSERAVWNIPISDRPVPGHVMRDVSPVNPALGNQLMKYQCMSGLIPCSRLICNKSRKQQY